VGESEIKRLFIHRPKYVYPSVLQRLADEVDTALLSGETVSVTARTLERTGPPSTEEAIAALVKVRERVRAPFVGGRPEVRATAVTMVLRPPRQGGDEGPGPTPDGAGTFEPQPTKALDA